MTSLTRRLAGAFLVAAGLSAPSAWAALGCTLSATPALLDGIYASGANLDMQGQLTLNCTRSTGDARKHDIWIGFNQPTTGQSLTHSVGSSTLTYLIYRRAFGDSVWTSIGSSRSNQSGNTGLEEEVDFGGGPSGSNAVTVTYPFYLRLPSGQNQPAGIYLGSGVGASVHSGTTSAGAQLSSTTVNARASIQHDCRFTTPPPAISLAYTAFSPAAVTTVAPLPEFGVTCTKGTSYTMALDLTRSVIPDVNLRYDITLGAATGTGVASEQRYTINVSIDAGQPGSCATITCTGTDVRTITVTY